VTLQESLDQTGPSRPGKRLGPGRADAIYSFILAEGTYGRRRVRRRCAHSGFQRITLSVRWSCTTAGMMARMSAWARDWRGSAWKSTRRPAAMVPTKSSHRVRDELHGFRLRL